MAALAATLKARVDAGNKWIEVWDVTGTVTGGTEDWVVTGLAKVAGAVATPRGITAAATASDVSLQKNAQGTSVAEDTNPGDVGIEMIAAHATGVDLIVIGD